MKTTDNGKMVNISLDEAKKLYRKGFQEIALKAYSIEDFELYKDIKDFMSVSMTLAQEVESVMAYMEESYKLYVTKNPLERLMLINKAMHLDSNKLDHHFFITKWGNIVRIKNPTTIESKTFSFATLEMAKHVWKYFKDEVIAAADYVAEF